jgi:hypothetical protein
VTAQLDEAITAARATHSAYLSRRLRAARAELAPLLGDTHIRRVVQEISELGTNTSTR